MTAKGKVLIICSQNSARSQMAEGFLRQYGSRWFEVFSAGFEPAPIHPLAIQAMQEIGIDISGQRSKSVKEYLGLMSFGHVIAVCKKAEAQCPVIFPGTFNMLSWPFDDPAALEGTAAEKLQEFRRIRDEIKNVVLNWISEMCQQLEASRTKVLFLCSHNSARSQMAESLMNSMMGDLYSAFSAGLSPGKLNPYVVKAMAELDVDISANRTKGTEEFINQEFDFVVTVCDKAGDACPWFPGAKQNLHQGFPDPSQFSGSEEEIMNQVRQVRDQIKGWLVKTFPC